MDENIQNSVEYEPLRPDSGFRIVILEPSTVFTSTIKCSLLTADLADHPPFEALSYVWGNSSKRRPIEVEGSTINVTVNLEQALRYLRLSDMTRYLWVDAICINQGNIAERNNHVRYMSEVYQRCTTDLLWLGKGNAIEIAVVAMKHYGNIFVLNKSFRSYLGDEHDDAKIEEEQKMEESLKCLFAKLPVWKRVWIVQEISFAPTVLLVEGHSILPWEKIEEFLDVDMYIEKYGIPDAFHGPFSHGFSIRSWANGAIAFPQIMSHQRRAVQTAAAGYKSSLLDVLARFRYTNATDPRDKIYGLLGLVSDKLGIEIDYSKPIKDVYVDCMRRLIQQDGNLDLLCQAPWRLGGNEKRSKDLPSWTIDFANPGDATILFAQRGIYNAGGDGMDLPIIVEDGMLKLKGVMLGELVSMPRDTKGKGDPPYPPGAKTALYWLPDALIHEAIRNGNASLSKFIKVPKPIATDESDTTQPHSFERFWRTITMDLTRYPMRRFTPADITELSPEFASWLSTPFDDAREIDLDFFVQAKMAPWYTWNFAVTGNGTYCMVPTYAKVGDCVAVLRGAKVPVVLRRVVSSKGLGERFTFVGACYVHEMMDGQAFGGEGENGVQEREFEVV